MNQKSKAEMSRMELCEALDAALARAEAAERRARENDQRWLQAERDGMRAESEAAALRAEVERLKTEGETAERTLRGDYQRAAEGLVACRARLAAAEALLGLMLESGLQPSLDRRIRAFLSTATQPAASAAPCTAEENLSDDELKDDRYGLEPAFKALSDAELARRAAAGGAK